MRVIASGRARESLADQTLPQPTDVTKICLRIVVTSSEYLFPVKLS